MYVWKNPVLQRELISNLRTPRAFWLMLVYQAVLAAVVLLAYPRTDRIDLSRDNADARMLVDFFFLGQFVIASLIAPSFAAGAITGEKERKTYEMLLASPIRPGAIVLGKLIAALTHLIVLMIGSLPIVMLCLPLGGVAIQELLAAYLGLLSAVFLFGCLSIACSSWFKRTGSSLVVSYALILPLVILGCVAWRAIADQGMARFVMTTTIFPAVSIAIGCVLLSRTARRLLYPPDVGSGGEEVIDLDKEQDNAVGLIIQRDQFPDKLFAPPRRTTLLSDHANPVFNKEIHAEVFGQGTLMLRTVILMSMFLAFPLMAIFLFYRPELAFWYIGYVLVFNILVAPVFSAGSVCSERERQTLDLLLTTTLSPWQILSGKFAAGFRVSFVLTMFLMWPVVLAFVLNGDLRRNWQAVFAYFGIVCMVAVFNSIVALFCSTLFSRTSVSMMMSYVALIALYLAPVAVFMLLTSLAFGATNIDPEPWKWIGITSPFMILENVPFSAVDAGRYQTEARHGSWLLVACWLAVTCAISIFLVGTASFLFRDRRRITIA
jgi:ABC-type transport system involved in multi-copper enzyme maturation permease subunit